MRLAATLFLLLVALVMFIGATAKDKELCMEKETADRMRALMLDGFDDAFREQTKHVFDIWIKDPTDQPRRAIQGMRGAAYAYVHSRAAAMNWNPPRCE